MIEDWFDEGDSQHCATDLVIEEAEPDKLERALGWVRSLAVATKVDPRLSGVEHRETKMASMFPRVYRSFEEFERSELQKFDHLYDSVDDMMDEMLASELEEDSRRRDDGILFDDIEELDDDDN